MLLVLDNRPFAELRETVRNTQDDRIWVYAEWVSCSSKNPVQEVLLTDHDMYGRHDISEMIGNQTEGTAAQRLWWAHI